MKAGLAGFPLCRIRQTAAPALALVGVVLYAYAVGPDKTGFADVLGFHDSPGDVPAYLNRFIASFLLLGVLPLGAAFVLGYRPGQLGLRWNGAFLKDKVFWVLAPLLVTSSLVGAFDPLVAGFYPFGKTIAGFANRESLLWFLLHGVLYVIFYYVPWEICFRGVMVWPLVGGPDELGARGELPASVSSGQAIVLASAQGFASTLLHLPHPMMETLGAVVFGIIGGFFVIRYRSIVPGLILHAFIGVALDLVLVLRLG